MYTRTRSRISRPTLVPELDLQSMGAEIKIYGEISNPNMRYFNPSIAFTKGGKLKIAIRSCNFAVERQGRWYFRDGGAYSKTDVVYGDLDPDTLQVSNLQKLELSQNTPKETQLAGLEDVRLFSRKDGMYAIGFESDRITRSLHNESASLAEYNIQGNTLVYMRTLPKPDPIGVEKNWSPTDIPSPHFDYTYSPTQIYHNGNVIGEKYTGKIHGGSQLLLQNDGTYLSLVHDKIINPVLNRIHIYDKYQYRHYLARHNSKGFITHLTKPFTFGTHDQIEFAGGMVEHDEQFIISLGIRDSKYAIAKIPKAKLTTLLQAKESIE